MRSEGIGVRLNWRPGILLGPAGIMPHSQVAIGDAHEYAGTLITAMLLRSPPPT